MDSEKERKKEEKNVGNKRFDRIVKTGESGEAKGERAIGRRVKTEEEQRRQVQEEQRGELQKADGDTDKRERI